MFERFSDQARRVVVSGQEEARRRGDGELGTEHMLLGLVDDDGCDGARALEMLHVSATDVRRRIDQLARPGERAPGATAAMPFTPEAKKVLELASREAVRLGHPDIGTEHLLLAMVREEHGVAARVLVGLGVDLSRGRETVVKLTAELGAKRERVRTNAPADDDTGDRASPEATTARGELLDYDDPAALGAAPTLPGAGTRKTQHVPARRERARSPVASDGTVAREAEVEDRIASGGSGTEVVSVFEAGRSVRPELQPYLEALWERRPFMKALAKAEIRGRRTSTTLGSIWGLIDPIFQAAIYLFLYFVIRGGQGRAISFLPVLLGGMFLFRYTGTAINEGGRSVRNSTELMLSSTFPRAVLPLSAVYKGFLNFIPSIFVFVIVYVLYGVPVHRSLVFLPLLFAIQTVMNVGIALIMSTATVFVRDVENALSMIVRILMFATPVVYPITLLPPGLKSILSLNPLFPLFANYQIIISGGGMNYGMTLQATVWAALLVFVGGWLFLRYEHAMAAAAA